MKSINIKARIRRNMLDKLAGEHYRDEYSTIVECLKSLNKTALVGIQREDGVYTILGAEKIYYSTSSGFEREIFIEDFLAILSKKAFSLGKSAQYEFVEIDEIDSIWVMNIEVMSALWNTMILLCGK